MKTIYSIGVFCRRLTTQSVTKPLNLLQNCVTKPIFCVTKLAHSVTKRVTKPLKISPTLAKALRNRYESPSFVTHQIERVGVCHV